jgi:hypothetical protein
LNDEIYKKTLVMNSMIKQLTSKPFLAIIIFAFILSSCATKMTFMNSPVVPGAKGDVEIKSDKNKNYHIDLDVVNLASPDQLTPPKQEYVVWAVLGSETKKIGRLVSSRSTLSKTMKGSLETVTTIQPSKIFITAEDNEDVTTPGPIVILETK